MIYVSDEVSQGRKMSHTDQEETEKRKIPKNNMIVPKNE